MLIFVEKAWSKVKTNTKLNPHIANYIWHQLSWNRIQATLVGGKGSHHWAMAAPCLMHQSI